MIAHLFKKLWWFPKYRKRKVVFADIYIKKNKCLLCHAFTEECNGEIFCPCKKFDEVLNLRY